MEKESCVINVLVLRRRSIQESHIIQIIWKKSPIPPNKTWTLSDFSSGLPCLYTFSRRPGSALQLHFSTMKIISDTNVARHILSSLTADSIVTRYIPALLNGLRASEALPEAVPPRTVRFSTTENSDTMHLFMPCVLPNKVGIKVISGGASNLKKGVGFVGSVMVLDDYTGETRALVNAKTLTAFRTALGSNMPLAKIYPPGATSLRGFSELLIFGAGSQAFWHAVVATRLYPQIQQVNVISRSLGSAEALCKDLLPVLKAQRVQALHLGDLDSVKKCVQRSEIIFGCMPSTEPNIRAEYLEGNAKYVSLIGSYKPHMSELDASFITQNYGAGQTKIIVDSKEHCLHEAGELIQNGIEANDLVSISELYDGPVPDIETPSGIVLAKLVGLLLMDIAIAKYFAENIDGVECDF